MLSTLKNKLKRQKKHQNLRLFHSNQWLPHYCVGMLVLPLEQVMWSGVEASTPPALQNNHWIPHMFEHEVACLATGCEWPDQEAKLLPPPAFKQYPLTISHMCEYACLVTGASDGNRGRKPTSPVLQQYTASYICNHGRALAI